MGHKATTYLHPPCRLGHGCRQDIAWNTKKGSLAGHRTLRGFTLIELSIVLVIIGLIVGGILTGQDMIKAAEIRATITQLERFNTAVNTFRGKYNGIPGDVLGGVSFFYAISNQNAGGPAPGNGNGDGLVQSMGVHAPCYNCVIGENAVFWYELSQAKLIADAIGSNPINTNYDPLIPGTIDSSVIPNAKVAGQISVNGGSGQNDWILASITGDPTAPTNAASLTPLQAFQIDAKIDDGAARYRPGHLDHRRYARHGRQPHRRGGRDLCDLRHERHPCLRDDNPQRQQQCQPRRLPARHPHEFLAPPPIRSSCDFPGRHHSVAILWEAAWDASVPTSW